MKRLPKLATLLLLPFISNNLFAQDPIPSLKGAVSVTDVPYERLSENFDIGLDHKVDYPTTLGHYASSLRGKTNEEKIRSAVGLFKIDRLSVNDDEILKRYDAYKAKVDKIATNNKIGLVTTYIPALGTNHSSTKAPVLDLTYDLNDGAYDFTNEKLYLYDNFDMEVNCNKPLVTNVPLYIKLNSCKRPYIHIKKSELKNIMDKGIEHFIAGLLFELENQKKLVKCPARGYSCIGDESMLDTKIKDIWVFIQDPNLKDAPTVFKVKYE